MNNERGSVATVLLQESRESAPVSNRMFPWRRLSTRPCQRRQVTAYEPSERSPSKLGSGFFISSDGLVATNLHVVAEPNGHSNTRVGPKRLRCWGMSRWQRRTDVVVLANRSVGYPWSSVGNSTACRLAQPHCHR